MNTSVLPPLPLPMPGQPFLELAPGERGPDDRADLALAMRFGTDVPAPPDSPRDRAFYRWMLGHHVAFCTWRQLSEILQNMVHNGVTEEGVDQAAWWYDRYTAAIVYAGSCDPDTYASSIRPKMHAIHSAFSGVWARDYTWILGLLNLIDVPATSTLKSAIKRNRLAHMAVAKALVPCGASLLKEAGRRASDEVTEVERAHFDSFFLVNRMSVPRQVFVAHAQRRVAAVVRDLARYPLTYQQSDELFPLPGDVVSVIRDITVALSQSDPGDARWTA